ncbi:hypothetical protein FRC03_000984 [Tulasnella sp. 419]|nr:hypothetical protein FRC03_000984 [Tulasnella sp. 419]
MSYLFRQPTGNSPSSSSSSSVPPSAFQRRGSNNNGVGGLRANSQSAEKNARRVSRTDMDFEQALKTGGTVVLEEGRRLESLGDGSSVASSSKGPNVTPRNRVATDPIVWNSPIVIPPTPTPSTTVQRPSTASSLSTGSHLPAMYGAYNIDDMDMQMKRRSLFRSAGTSSSPDLATLLIKAKQRGGVVGSTSNTTTTDEDSSAETASASHKNPAPETSVSASGHLHPDPSNSNVEERSRTRTRSSSSSSYSIVSSNISISESPPSKSQSRGTKAEKILGMSGIVGIGSVDGFSPNKNQAKDSKTLRSTVRNKTSAFWTRMTGQGTTREQRSGSTTCTSGGTSIPNTPVTPSYATSFSTYSAGSSLNVSPTTPKLSVSPAPPVPPLPSNYRSRPAVGSDVFTSPSSNKPLPIRPSTARPSTAHSQPKKTEVVSSDEEVDLDQALQLAPPRTSNKANQKSFHGRRRSLSVGDVVIDIRPGGRYSLDQRQPSPLGGGGQPSPKSSNEQSDGPGPESAPPSAFPLSEKNMLEGWNLPSVGIGGFRGAFDSYTTTPTSLVSSPKTESFGPISSQRPSRARSHTTTVPLQSGSGLQQGSPNPDELDLSRRPSTASMASASTADSSGSHFQNDYRPLGPPPPLSGIKKRVVRPHHQRHNPQLSISSDKTAIQGNNNAEESGEDGFVTAGTGTDTDVDVSSPSSAISKQPGSAVSSATSTGFSSGFPSRSTSLRARSGSNPTVSSHSNGGGGGHPPSLRGGPLPSNRGGEPAFKFTSPSYESLTLRKSRSQSRNQADSMGMVIRRGSDDAAMGGGGGGNVNLENGRTVRLGISPSMVPGHLLQQMRAAGGSMSSLDVSSGGAGAGGGQVNPVDEELLEERGKEAAEKCWNEDESFKPREKIAEYLGGVTD